MADMNINTGSFEVFDYKKFCDEHKRNRKMRTFLGYIEETFGELDKRNVLLNLNEKNIIDSLQHYILVGGQSQTTAKNYFTYLTQLFEELSQKYNIKNDIFINKERYKMLKNEIYALVSTLKETNSKDIASDDEYETMQDEVEKVECWINREDVRKALVNINSGKVKNYSKILSVVAMNLVLDYGFKGIVLINIKLEHYDENANTLNVNDIIIPLKEKYISLMKLYIRARQVILDNNICQSEMLFINKAGKNFNATRHPDYGALFHIAEESVGSIGMERYAENRIVKMIARGVDVNTLVKLTGVGMEKIYELQEFYNKEVKGLNPSDYFSSSEDAGEEFQYIEEKVNYLKCPVCQRLVTTEAKEWIVVKYENYQQPLLSCRYCGGIHEESRI